MGYNFCIQARARLPGWRDERSSGMVKCRYPDCDGELEPGAAYCEECGRSQAATQVATAMAGAQVRVQAPPARLAPDLPRMRPPTPPLGNSALVPTQTGQSARPSRDLTIPLPVVLAFGLLLTLLIMGLMGALAIAIVTSPLIPLPATARPTPPPGGFE